jgi:hypothetical protein
MVKSIEEQTEYEVDVCKARVVCVDRRIVDRLRNRLDGGAGCHIRSNADRCSGY